MYCSRMTRAGLSMAVALMVGTAPALAQDAALGQPAAVSDPDEPITVSPSDDRSRGGAGFEADIGSTSLAAPSVEAAGLTGAGALGLDAGMWGTTPGARAIALVEAVEPTQLHSMNRLVRRVLVAGATPPDGSDGLLASRAQALIRFGAAEEAASLTGAAGRDPGPMLRRTRAEAALIVGREETLCERDVLGADAPPVAAGDTDRFWSSLRAYCLARTGEPLAAVAVNAMVELGSVAPTDAPLLEALIDDSLIDYVPVPHASMLTPLRIAMLRSLGRANRPAIESAPLPMIAGLFALESTGADGALIAAERLESVGAIETQVLREMYVSFADAVDGDLAKRAQAVRAAQQAPAVQGIGQALLEAAGSDEPGRFAQMSRVLAPMAARTPLSQATDGGTQSYAMRDAMLLGGRVEAAGAWSQAQGPRSPEETADIAAVMAVADADWAARWQRPYGDALRLRTQTGDEHARRTLGALAGLGVALRPDLPNEGYLAAAREGRAAETVLAVAAELGTAFPPSARTLDTMIRAFDAIGLREEARKIAIEAMIVARWR